MPTPSGHTSAICATRVTGTAVKDEMDRKIGRVEDIVLDKQSNTILFAVVTFGGLFGFGKKYHPIPWSALDYDEGEHSYLLCFRKEELEAAPSAASLDELTKDDGTPYRNLAYDHYKTPYHW